MGGLMPCLVSPQGRGGVGATPGVKGGPAKLLGGRSPMDSHERALKEGGLVSDS